MSSNSVAKISRGKLKFKGSHDNSAKKRKIEVLKTTEEAKDEIDPNQFLTEAQKKHIEKMKENEYKEVKLVVNTTYRERLEKFNTTLATMSEHNDIPRVSAAGNG